MSASYDKNLNKLVADPARVAETDTTARKFCMAESRQLSDSCFSMVKSCKSSDSSPVQFLIFLG